jgi:hypothetical protein
MNAAKCPLVTKREPALQAAKQPDKGTHDLTPRIAATGVQSLYLMDLSRKFKTVLA